MAAIDECLAGRALWGDDFPPDAIEAWWASEREAYAELGAGDCGAIPYAYHALHRICGFRHLAGIARFPRVLGFGAAWGDEFLGIIDRVGELTIVDPSETMTSRAIGGRPATYVRPRPDGVLPFPDGQFDLISCHQVLHHIPNVTAVTRELARVLAPEGVLLLCEPTTSMGDWRRPRPGLTARERGIPRPLLLKILAGAGLRVLRETRCIFPLTRRLGALTGHGLYNSAAGVWLDLWLSRLFDWNRTYHATHPLAKLRPTSSYFVLRRAQATA